MRRLLPVILFFLVVVPAASAWTWPVRGPVVQSFDFDRAHPYGAGQHRGIAIDAPAGTPVRAPVAGIVSFAGAVPGSGRSLTIRTEDGLAVTVTELGSLSVARGAPVAEGDEIAAAGSDPVHLGVREAADEQGYLDPLRFLPAPPTTPDSRPRAASPAPAPAPAPAPVAPAPAPVATAPLPAAAPVPATGPAAAPSPAPAPVSTPAPSPASVEPLPVSADPPPATDGSGLRLAARAVRPVHIAAQAGSAVSASAGGRRPVHAGGRSPSAAASGLQSPVTQRAPGSRVFRPRPVPRVRAAGFAPAERRLFERAARSARRLETPEPRAGITPAVASEPGPRRPLWQLVVGIAASIGAVLASIVALLRVPALRRGRLAT